MAYVDTQSARCSSAVGAGCGLVLLVVDLVVEVVVPLVEVELSPDEFEVVEEVEPTVGISPSAVSEVMAEGSVVTPPPEVVVEDGRVVTPLVGRVEVVVIPSSTTSI